MNQADFTTLAEMMAAGKLAPAIDRRYPLDQAAAALGYVDAGHAHAKAVITPLSW